MVEFRWTRPLWLALLLGCLLPGVALSQDLEEDTTAAPELVEEPSGEALKPTERDYELFRLFVDTFDQVERNYVEEIDRRELMEAAIQGLLTKLDPYSNYVSPEEIANFRTSIENKFGGIGIQVGLEDGTLTVLSPLVDTPAYRAGIHAGDQIVAIEGESTKGMSLNDAVKLLKGEVGTSVTVTIKPAYVGENRDVKLTREIVRVETVLGDARNPDDTWNWFLDRDNKIGYIRVSSFGSETARDVRDAVRQLKREGMQGLILDLRFNPGGLLDAAIKMCDLFIEEGRIVSTKGRNVRERAWEAHRPGTFGDFPMVVLVNRYSASASEVVSACLQDHERAVIIGERTWGKGSVQNVVELEGGRSALKLTTASYHRPSGKNIHRGNNEDEDAEWGVMPNDGFEVKLDGEEVRKMLEARRLRDRLDWTEEQAQAEAAGDDPTQVERPLPEAHIDGQLAKALEYLKSQLDEGLAEGDAEPAGGDPRTTAERDTPENDKPKADRSSS